MQDLLPVAIRGILRKNVRQVIIVFAYSSMLFVGK